MGRHFKNRDVITKENGTKEAKKIEQALTLLDTRKKNNYASNNKKLRFQEPYLATAFVRRLRTVFLAFRTVLATFLLAAFLTVLRAVFLLAAFLTVLAAF